MVPVTLALTLTLLTLALTTDRNRIHTDPNANQSNRKRSSKRYMGNRGRFTLFFRSCVDYRH